MMVVCGSALPAALILLIYGNKTLRRLAVYPLQLLLLVPGYFVGRKAFRWLSIYDPDTPSEAGDFDDGPGGPVGPTSWDGIDVPALIAAVVIGLTVDIALRLLITHKMVAAFDYSLSDSDN
jgi:hypothetical protein